MAFTNIEGNLLKYAELESGSLFHADELQRARLTDASLRGFSFYTGDGCLYRVQNEEVQLGLTRISHNLVLRNLENAFRELVDTRNYHPKREEAEAAFAANDTVIFDLNKI